MCCTTTMNTVFSMILWKKISLEYCLPNQRFNFNMLFFPIVWREISEKILHVFSLLLLDSPESSGICGFFSGVISLVPISIPHQYSYITYKWAFYVMMPFLFFFLRLQHIGLLFWYQLLFSSYDKEDQELTSYSGTYTWKSCVRRRFSVWQAKRHNKIQWLD